MFWYSNPPSKLPNFLFYLITFDRKMDTSKNIVFMQLLKTSGQGGERPKILLKEQEAV